MANFSGVATGTELANAAKAAGNLLAGMFFLGLLVGAGLGALVVHEIYTEELEVTRKREAESRKKLSNVSDDLMRESSAKLGLAKELKRAQEHAASLNHLLATTKADLAREVAAHEEAQRTIRTLSQRAKEADAELKRYRDSEIQGFFASLPLEPVCGVRTPGRAFAASIVAASTVPTVYVPGASDSSTSLKSSCSFVVVAFLLIGGSVVAWRTYSNRQPPVIYKGSSK